MIFSEACAITSDDFGGKTGFIFTDGATKSGDTAK
jgi:hypothetical protein